ncbi:MAG: permease [Deltaproteobacteria bacterium]|nr:permease [Deltaproteobacteria bacterium]MBW2137736.1 permease [Deltaproteobacteria bacterium]
MLIAFLVLLVMGIALFIAALRRGGDCHVRGLIIGKSMLIGVIPLLLVAFLVAGLIQVAIPPEIIRSWLGEESGLRGILLGTLAGALIPGGPYIALPIIAAIAQGGAGIGTIVSLISAWALIGIGQLPFELALIGPRFMAVRISSVVIFPPVAGLLARALFA